MSETKSHTIPDCSLPRISREPFYVLILKQIRKQEKCNARAWALLNEDAA